MSKLKTELHLADAAKEEPVASIQKIRDILFGGQMREYEGRFVEIEQLLYSDLAKLRSELNQGMKRLEQELRGELRRLGEADASERSERQLAQQAMDRKLAQLGEELLAKLSVVDRRGSEQLGALRETMGRDFQQLNGTLSTKFGEIEQQHRRGQSGNDELATLLRGIADRLQRPAE